MLISFVCHFRALQLIYCLQIIDIISYCVVLNQHYSESFDCICFIFLVLSIGQEHSKA